MDISVAANITLARLDATMRHGFIDDRRERAIADEWIQRLRIKTPSASQVCRNLSGGNQQKIVIARWLTARSRILILDHPTRGLDVGAKEEVYDMIRNPSAEGIAIVLTSDKLRDHRALPYHSRHARRRDHRSFRRAALCEAGPSRAVGVYGMSAAGGLVRMAGKHP